MQPLVAGDPSVIGPYRLLGRLGAGGMGRVFLGRSPGGRTVAVKIVRPELAADSDFRDRFRREVAAARKVGGAWTAPVLDADTESDGPWVATGYVAGPALADAVAEFGPLSEHGVRALVAGLAEALVAVHGQGLIHRDIKPSNVMLSPAGPVLIDFGIARAMDGATTADLTRSGLVIGSPGYMSPEQVQGLALGAASDVFQLGTVLVHAATGQGPFVADNPAALLYKVVHGEPELGSIQGELRTLAEDCLAKDPAARPTPQQIVETLAPQGASALVNRGWLAEPLMAQLSRRMVELLNLEAGSAEALTQRIGFPVAPTVKAPVGEPEVPRSGRRRTRGWLAALGAVALVGAVALTLTWLAPTGNADSPDNAADNSTTQPTAGASPSPSPSPIQSPSQIPSAFLGDWTGTLQGGSTIDGTLDLTVATGGTPAETEAEAIYHLTSGSVCHVDYQLVSEPSGEVGLYNGVVAPEDRNASCAVIGSQAHLSRESDGTLTYTGPTGDGDPATAHLTPSHA